MADLKSHETQRTLKRAGEALETNTDKEAKVLTEALNPSCAWLSPTTIVSSPKSSGTRRKSNIGSVMILNRVEGFYWFEASSILWQIRSMERLYTPSNDIMS
ncbi:hypothetical protein Tco_0084232 [Tanacetum coccineum]